MKDRRKDGRKYGRKDRRDPGSIDQSIGLPLSIETKPFGSIGDVLNKLSSRFIKNPGNRTVPQITNNNNSKHNIEIYIHCLY